MEHYSTTHYLMWMKSRNILNTTKFPSSKNSFSCPSSEEALGGLTWPPRSYSCAFCRREFRSAQALGGHMNVHRRDRARLKQSSPPQQAILHQNKLPEPFIYSQDIRRKPALRDDGKFVGTKFSVGTDLVDHAAVICKRQKISGVSPFPFFHSKLCSSAERYNSSSSMEEIDLELRLGNPPPAVK